MLRQSVLSLRPRPTLLASCSSPLPAQSSSTASFHHAATLSAAGGAKEKARWSKSGTARKDSASKPPRYLTRAMKEPAPTTKRDVNPRFRSRHSDATPVNSSNQSKDGTMRLLQPHVLAQRLKNLAAQDRIDVAIQMLQNAPLAAQNTPVWNTLIWECMKAKRFKSAYALFVDMKRRGMVPTTRTFQTMFNGYARIEVWASHTQQMSNVRSLYEFYQRHIEMLKKKDPHDPELGVDALSGYISILGNAGRFDEIFVLYHTWLEDGNIASNKYIFTAMFKALSASNAGVSATQLAKNATDARVLWAEVVTAKRESGLEVDSFLVTAAIATLSRGQKPEHKLAFQIAEQYLGLKGDGQPADQGLMPLTAQSFAAILSLCNASDRPADAIHFFEQVKRRPAASGGLDIVDRAHIEELLRAHLAREPQTARAAVELLEFAQEVSLRAGNKIRPGTVTFNLALTLCWRTKDWNSASKVFSQMTGYHAHDFADGAVRAVPRTRRQGLVPTPETMSLLLRTALATENPAAVRQCLRIVAHFHYNVAGLFVEPEDVAPRTRKNWGFHVQKAAAAVNEAVQFIKTRDQSSEVREWEKLQRVALAQGKRGDVAAAPPKKPTTTRRGSSRYEMAFV